LKIAKYETKELHKTADDADKLSSMYLPQFRLERDQFYFCQCDTD